MPHFFLPHIVVLCYLQRIYFFITVLCSYVVEHKEQESEGFGFNSLSGLSFCFSLVTRRIISVSEHRRDHRVLCDNLFYSIIDISRRLRLSLDFVHTHETQSSSHASKHIEHGHRCRDPGRNIWINQFQDHPEYHIVMVYYQ